MPIKDNGKDDRDSWPSMGYAAFARLCLPAAARASAEARGHKVDPQAEWALRTEVTKEEGKE